MWVAFRNPNGEIILFMEDRFQNCKYGFEEWEVVEDDGSEDLIRYCKKGCNPYLDCYLNCKYFEKEQKNA